MSVAESLHPRVIVVVGPKERPKWVIFRCPCGRGHQIFLSLQSSHKPHWRLQRVGTDISLHPSIDSHLAYRCHFWLTDGRISWAKDELVASGS